MHVSEINPCNSYHKGLPEMTSLLQVLIKHMLNNKQREMRVFQLQAFIKLNFDPSSS
jgi:hypothetical protein